MKTHLLHPKKDFDWRLVRRAAEVREADQKGWWRRDEAFDEHMGLPWNEVALRADLSLDTVFDAMGRGDAWLYEASKRVILASTHGDLETIAYRQGVLQDGLKHRAAVRQLYSIAVEAREKQKGHYFSDFVRSHPDSMLRESIGLMEDLLGSLKNLHGFAQSHADRFTSAGWTQLFVMLQRDLDDDYLAQVEQHLKALKQRHESLLLSAKLGQANTGTHYLLHRSPHDDSAWWQWPKSLLLPKRPVYSFRLNPRDEAGHQALAKLRDRGTGSVAAALGQSADNISDFFNMLQAELAFYVGCINLHESLERKGEPVCIPTAAAAGERRLSAQGLYDIGLSLSVDKRTVGNDINGDDKNLVIITGANTGGKSTFLRSVGIAQLMMQTGMFVPAKTFAASICHGIFTHYKREEDAEMDSGKFDEELSRMNEIVEHIKPQALVLLNESFAATNEREGSEIARQIIAALLNKKVTVVCVTHLYELAHGFVAAAGKTALFLRADHKADGTRTFKMNEGGPLPTSYGKDIYDVVFGRRKK